MTYREIAATLKEVEEVMIPPGGVKRKLDGLVDSVPPHKGCEMLDGEVTDEEWDENGSETFADSDDAHILLKWECHYEMPWGLKSLKKCNMTPLQ